ncbi:MAG: hypothetical protein ABFS46_15635 [Myxococcota bacterium]
MRSAGEGTPAVQRIDARRLLRWAGALPAAMLASTALASGAPAPSARISTFDDGPVLEIAETGYVVLDGCSSKGAESYRWTSSVGRFYGHCRTKVGLLCKVDADCDWGDGDACLDVQDQCRAHLRDVPTRGRHPLGTVTLAINGADCTAANAALCDRVSLRLPRVPPLRGARVWSNLAQDYDRLEDPVEPKWPAPRTVVDYLSECRGIDDCHYLVGHNTPKNVAGQSEDFWRELRPVLEHYWEAIERHNARCAEEDCRVREDGILLDWRFDLLFRYDQADGCSVEATRQLDPPRPWKVCGAPLGSDVPSQDPASSCPGEANSCIDTWGYFGGLTTQGGRDPTTEGGQLSRRGLFVPKRWSDAVYRFWGDEGRTICSDEGPHHFGFGIDKAWHCAARRQAPFGRCFGGAAHGQTCNLADEEDCPAGSCLEAVPAAYAKTKHGRIAVTAPGMLDWRHPEARRQYIDSMVYLLEEGAGLAEHPDRCLAWSWQGYSWVFWDRGRECGIGRVGCSDLADPANSRTGLVLGRPGFDGGAIYPNPYGPGESEFFVRGLLLKELRDRLDAAGLCVTLVPNFAKSMAGILPRGPGATSWDIPDAGRRATAGYYWLQHPTSQAVCSGGSRAGESCAMDAKPCEEAKGSCQLVGTPFNGSPPRVTRAPDEIVVVPGQATHFEVSVVDDGRPLVFPSNESAGLRCEYEIRPLGRAGNPPEVDPPCRGAVVEPDRPESCRGATVRLPEGSQGSCVVQLQASDHDRLARSDSRSRRTIPLRVRNTPTAGVSPAP